MLKSSFVSLLAVSTVAYAQFALKIAQPQDQEFIQIGSTIPVEIQAPVRTMRPYNLCTSFQFFYNKEHSRWDFRTRDSTVALH